MEKRSSQSLEKAHSLRSRLETRPLRRPLLSGLKIDKIWASEHEIEGSQMKEKRETEKKESNKRLEWSKNQGEELRKRNIKLDKKNLVVSNRLEVSKKVIAFYSIDSVEPRQSKFTERFFLSLPFLQFFVSCLQISHFHLPGRRQTLPADFATHQSLPTQVPPGPRAQHVRFLCFTIFVPFSAFAWPRSARLLLLGRYLSNRNHGNPEFH